MPRDARQAASIARWTGTFQWSTLVKAKSPKAWKKDLTTEGIEPHPGPRQRTVVTPTLWQINLRSWTKRGHRLLQQAAKLNIDCVLIQETFLDQDTAVQIAQANAEWHFFHQNAKTKPRAPRPAAHHDNHGEWLRVVVGDWNLICCYQRPNLSQDQISEWQDQLGQELAKLRASKWLLAGDFNSDPREAQNQIFAASLFAQVSYVHETPDCNSAECFPEPLQTKALTKAVRLTTWIRALPYSLEEKLCFYKATAVAVVAASRYVRLFSQEN